MTFFSLVAAYPYALDSGNWLLHPFGKSLPAASGFFTLANDDTQVLYNEIGLDASKWTIETDFSGDNGLIFWYSRGIPALSLDLWDGLVVAVKNGTVTGYLNDGSGPVDITDPKKSFLEPTKECKVSDPSSLNIAYKDGFFRILLNGIPCFETQQIVLGPGNIAYSKGTVKDVKVIHEIVPGPENFPTPPPMESKTKSKVDQKDVILSRLNSGLSGSQSVLSLSLISTLQTELSALKSAHSDFHQSINQELNALHDTIQKVAMASADVFLPHLRYPDFQASIDSLNDRLNMVQQQFSNHLDAVPNELFAAVQNRDTGLNSYEWIMGCIVLVMYGYIGWKMVNSNNRNENYYFGDSMI